MLLFDRGSELVNLVLTFGSSSFVLLTVLFELVKTFLITFFVLLDLLLAFLFALGSTLNLRVVQQPFGQEVNGVLGIGPVHNSHSFGDDGADFVTLQVLGIRS